MPVVAAISPAMEISGPQATIVNTGSTNTPGMTMTVDAAGNTEVRLRSNAMRQTTVDSRLSQRLFDDLKTIGPLSSLPKIHCMKSASFGSSVYVEVNGERSPDLSCPAPRDSKTAILKRDVYELMQAAHPTPQPGTRIPTTVSAKVSA